MKNSRNKGKVGERELAKYLTSLGFDASRGVQYQGGTDSPDVVCKALSGVHIECKRVEGLDLGTKLLDAACEQAKRDAGEKFWAVLWRPNRSPSWRMTFDDEVIGRVTVYGDEQIKLSLSLAQSAALALAIPQETSEQKASVL